MLRLRRLVLRKHFIREWKKKNNKNSDYYVQKFDMWLSVYISTLWSSSWNIQTASSNAIPMQQQKPFSRDECFACSKNTKIVSNWSNRSCMPDWAMRIKREMHIWTQFGLANLRWNDCRTDNFRLLSIDFKWKYWCKWTIVELCAVERTIAFNSKNSRKKRKLPHVMVVWYMFLLNYFQNERSLWIN